jgi:MFS transporter, DHA3 family, macrolide efflux protein
MSIWKNKNYVKYFIANSFSSFGDMFDIIAMLMLFTYTWSAEPFLIALIPITYAVPSIALSHVGGIVADRYNKKLVLLYTNGLMGLLTLLLFLASSPSFALCILTLRSAVTVFKLPAQTALIRSIVSEAHLLQAISLNSIVFQASKVVAPLLGGMLLAVCSPKYFLLLNAGTFCIAFFMMMYLSYNEQSKAMNEKVERFRSFFTGWGIIFKDKLLFYSIILFHLGYFLVMFIDAQISVFTRQAFPTRPEILTYIISSLALGAVGVGIWLNRKKSLSAPIMMMSCGIGFLGIAASFLGIYEQKAMSIYWLFFMAMVGGAGMSLNLMSYSYLVQQRTPKEFLGRVQGFTQSVTSTVILGAPLAGGTFVQWFGIQPTFLVVGIAAILLCLASFFFNVKLKHKEEREVEQVKISVH